MTVTVTLRRPRGCPRWLWRVSSRPPVIHVAGKTIPATWDTTVEVPVPRSPANLVVTHRLVGVHRSTDEVAGGEVWPGDVVTFRASWFQRRRRRLRTT